MGGKRQKNQLVLAFMEEDNVHDNADRERQIRVAPQMLDLGTNAVVEEPEVLDL